MFNNTSFSQNAGKFKTLLIADKNLERPSHN